jgi:nucleoside-diphosphate-sugar epimerase
MSRNLVTGGADFLGINLCRHLRGRGHIVASMDIARFEYAERSVIDGDIRDRGHRAHNERYRYCRALRSCTAARSAR